MIASLPFRILTAAIALSVATAATFMREKPPEAHTGAFGEPTCQECHSGEPLNQAPGTVTIFGLPQFYSPGKSYVVTVTLSAPELQVGGFQMTARFDNGQQAGRLEASSTGTTVSALRGIEYASHTLEGIAATRNKVRWAVVWHAPEEARMTVVFNVAANASNDDASPLGDHIYTAKATTGPGTP